MALLKQALPGHAIVLAAPAVFAPFVELSPSIDRLFPSTELMRLNGFDGPVDIGIDLHGNGPASRELLAELNPGRLIGFANAGAGLAGPVWRADEHEVHRWCRLVCEGLGVDLPFPGVAGSIAVPEVAVPAAVSVVHPGAAAASRRWPADRFVQVARELRRQGHRVVVTGGGSERLLVSRIAVEAGVEPAFGMSLLELAGVIAAARLVVCGDTGVAHLASAYRTPSVVLFGPVSPANWGPPIDPRHVVLWHGDGTGDPHGAEPDPALLRISVSEVLAAATRLAELADDELPKQRALRTLG